MTEADRSDGRTPDVVVTSANAADLFTVRTAGRREGSPDFMDVAFDRIGDARAEFGGGGIYAVHHDGALLYVGKYTGDKRVPYAGDVVKERLAKHLEAITMRGRRVSLRSNNYDAAVAMPSSPLVDAIRLHPMLRDGPGGVRSYPCKVAFAAARWRDMLAIGTDEEQLARFDFVYGRLDPGSANASMDYRTLSAHIGAVENSIIEALRPVCNVKLERVDQQALATGPGSSAWDGLREEIRARTRATAAVAA